MYEHRVKVVDNRKQDGRVRLADCSAGDLVERVLAPGVPLIVMWTSADGTPGCNSPGYPHGLFDPTTGMSRRFDEKTAAKEYVRRLYGVLVLQAAADKAEEAAGRLARSALNESEG